MKENDPIQLMQFVRNKGKMEIVFRPDGKVIRDSRGKIVKERSLGSPRGVLVAGMIDGKVCVGWSYVHEKVGDKFDKTRALDIATGRMTRPTKAQIPHKVLSDFEKTFKPRAEKYFGSPVSI